MKTSKKNPKEWNSSADLVRVTAMLMVVILHVVRMSGFLDMPYAQDATAKWISNIWETPTIIAVNLFAMLTGYLCVDKKWKIKRIFYLWWQTSFYVIVFAVIFAFAGQKTTLLHLAHVLFPLTSFYWYVVAYSALFVLIPFLNRGIQALNRRDCLMLCVILVLTLSVFGYSSTNALAQNGHCVLWLGVMYICGAFIKLHSSPLLLRVADEEVCISHSANKKIAWIVFLLCCVAGCLVLKRGGQMENLLFRHYQSPIVCIEAIACFFIIIHMQIRNVWLCATLRFLSPMAFGVYLFHCCRYMWEPLGSYLSGVAEQTHYPWWFIPVFSVAVYALGTCIDYVRIKLFQLCRVPELCQFLASKMPACIRQMEEW